MANQDYNCLLKDGGNAASAPSMDLVVAQDDALQDNNNDDGGENSLSLASPNIEDIHTSLSRAVEGERSKALYGTFEYEPEGVPWWMPVNAIENENDLNVFDGLQIHEASPQPGAPPLSDNNDNNNNRSKKDENEKKEENEKDFLQLLETKRVQKVILLDFHVGNRKFSLYTSVFLFLVIATNIASGITNFYEIKGYFFNGIVIIFLVYGLIVSFMCSDPIKSFEKHKYHRIVYNLQFYWLFGWATAVLLFFTAIYYIIKFPSKYGTYCDEHGTCDGSNNTVKIMGVISLCITLIMYILLILFYMDRIGKLVIYSGHLGVFAYRQDWDCYICCFTIHKHCYRFRRIFKNIRRGITKATGMRLNDIIYCQCWFRSCKLRNQNGKINVNLNNNEWKPVSLSQNEREYNDLEKLSKKEKNILILRKQVEKELSQKDILMQESYNKQKIESEKEKEIEKAKAKNREKSNKIIKEYDYQPLYVNMNPGPGPLFMPPPAPHRPPPHYHGGPPIHNGGGAGPFGPPGPGCDCHLCLHDCGICCREGCDALCAFPRCLCHCCLHGPGDLCHGCHDMKCDCNCSGGDCSGGGEAIAYIGFAILVAVLFVLPLIILALFIAPFWLLAQAISYKLKYNVPYFIIIVVFIICLIIPFSLWYLMFTAICENASSDNTLLTVFCLIWSFFHAIFNLT